MFECIICYHCALFRVATLPGNLKLKNSGKKNLEFEKFINKEPGKTLIFHQF